MTDNHLYPASAAPAKPAYRKNRTRPVTPGETVYLDGKALVVHCAHGGTIAYSWSFISVPDGSRASMLRADQCRASFVPDVAGRYRVRLEASTGSGMLRVVKEVRVSLDDSRPVAVARAESVLVMTGAPIRLNGSASENPLSDSLAYEWRITAAPEGSIATLSYAASESPMVFPDREGRYEVSLSVSNCAGPGTTDRVSVNVVSPESLGELTTESTRDTTAGIDFGRTYTARELNALKRAVRVCVAAPSRQVEIKPALQPERERVVYTEQRTDAPTSQRFQSLIRHIRILLHDSGDAYNRPAASASPVTHTATSRR